MRAVVQRVQQASVRAGDEIIGEIGPGVVVFVGVGRDDSAADADYLAAKIAGLRIFEDAEGLMNISLSQGGGEVLSVSQFTLFGDCRKGRRPGFSAAAPPEEGRILYEHFCQSLRREGLKVAMGRFQAHMLVLVENDGPVTILLDSKKLF